MHPNLKSLYEKYHQKTRLQKRVIHQKNFTYRLILSVLEPYLVDEKRILDIGCGAGTLSFYMASKGNNVVGIDISSRVISVCKLNAKNLNLEKNVNFKVVDFLKARIDKHFDLVLCSEVLEHLVDDHLALQKIFDNLKQSGLVFISAPSRNAPLLRLGFLRKFDEKVGHLRRYGLNQIVDLLRNQKFKILEARKTEGILRNFLFVSRLGSPMVRVANRFSIVSDIFTFFDNITLRLFGESQIIVVAQKPEKEER